MSEITPKQQTNEQRLLAMLTRLSDLYAAKLVKEGYDPDTILHGQVGRARELIAELTAKPLVVELNDGTPHTIQPEAHLVWREVAQVEGEDRPRLLVPHSDPHVYENALDGLFATEQQAYEYLNPFGAEAGQELVLCRLELVPVRVVKYTENTEDGKWTVEDKYTREAMATDDC